MNNLPFLSLFLCLMISFAACQREKSRVEYVVKVFDQVLTRDDLASVTKAASDQEDSARLAESFIRSWATDQILLRKAEMNLTDEQKDVDRLIEDYRHSLIIYRYKSELLKTMLDTAVSQKDIQTYYDEHQNDFVLQDYILKTNFIKIGKEVDKAREIINLFKRSDPDTTMLRVYCETYAANYLLNDDAAWIFLEDLMREVPIKPYNIEQFLRTKGPIQIDDNDYTYIIKILDYRLKDSFSPLALEVGHIRNRIVNRRKVELINKIEEDLYRDAYEKGNIIRH